MDSLIKELAALSPPETVTRPQLLHLPDELHQEIIACLGAWSANMEPNFMQGKRALHNLRMVNRYLRTLVSNLNREEKRALTPPITHKALLRLEKRAGGNLGYTC